MKRGHRRREIKAQTQHKEPEHMHLKFLTQLTCNENSQSSWVKIYYSDNTLLIKGYQVGEIPVLGQMMGFCKRDMGKFLIVSIC